jgi:hypothetical protein
MLGPTAYDELPLVATAPRDHHGSMTDGPTTSRGRAGVEASSPGRRIADEVSSWPGVEAGAGGRGEFSFKVGRREIGHLHGDRVAHFGFPKQVWHELYDQGRVDYHPVFPGKPGFAARRIDSEADVVDVIELLRLNYDRVVERHGLPATA